MISKTIQNYNISRQLGQGGMATVYLAHDNKFNTNVAIKVLNKEFVNNENIRKRFIAEARNMFKMSHPNIIKVTDLIDEGDTVAFVMEYIEGETLKEYLDRKGKLNDDEIKTIFSQMLEAVGYVHDKKLVHRDIKPSNFMITPKGQIKLLDFGIAKNTDVNSADYTQTGTSQNMGTPMYMSPEQIKSTKGVTLQSDIYSLGVVLWQMVMCKKPYDSNTLSSPEIQVSILKEPLPITNSNWDTIIQKATAKEVLNRYETCLEIKKAMNKLTKKSKGSKVEDKTILVNTNENTFVESNVFVEKELEVNHKKSNLESREINNYIVSPEIIKTNTSSIQSKKNRNYLILGIIVLIVILGLIIANNNFYTPQKKNIKTAVKVATPIKIKIVSFTNDSNYPLYLAYGLWNNNEWESRGWYIIEPNNSAKIHLPNSFKDNYIYYYAYNLNGSIWGGTNAYLCVNSTDAFNYSYTANCNEKKGFRKLGLTGSYTKQSLYVNSPAKK